jgi:hypothetical protein
MILMGIDFQVRNVILSNLAAYEFMDGFRLGDVIDDYCIKCRRLTNHAIVSILDGAAAKVRCRTCYHDHDYRREIAPPTKKELKQAELYRQVLAGAAAAPEGAPAEAVEPQPEMVPEEIAVVEAIAVEEPPAAAPKKRARKTSK